MGAAPLRNDFGLVKLVCPDESFSAVLSFKLVRFLNICSFLSPVRGSLVGTGMSLQVSPSAPQRSTGYREISNDYEATCAELIMHLLSHLETLYDLTVEMLFVYVPPSALKNEK